MTGSKDIFIHPTAVVDKGARIGPGTKVWHLTHFAAGSTIGSDGTIGQNVYFAPTVVIGDGVKIQNNVSVYDGVFVEDYAFLGPSCVFTNVRAPRSRFQKHGVYEKTRVGRGVTIGANATIVCGTTLGDHCLVAAGSVVTKDVAAFSVVMGSPARPAGWACMCGASIGFDRSDSAVCPECARHYRKQDGTVSHEEG